MTEIQPFAALDKATEAALRASIRRFGVIVPVVQTPEGRILDGHHRVRIAREEGVEFPIRYQKVRDDEEAREIAITLNADRRHLTR
ncbi:MAG: ParB N-terminal domain-containing protein, partial [Acidimicrobiia bacterium]|nr:ParB N-terminal domain-containing protein [Acidimicrobiia bacterium]